jgi:hypothetical protein
MLTMTKTMYIVFVEVSGVFNGRSKPSTKLGKLQTIDKNRLKKSFKFQAFCVDRFCNLVSSVRLLFCMLK